MNRGVTRGIVERKKYALFPLEGMREKGSVAKASQKRRKGKKPVCGSLFSRNMNPSPGGGGEEKPTQRGFLEATEKSRMGKEEPRI